MSGKTLNYYAAGNTANGFINLFDSVLQGLERLFILKGGPGTGKSTLMKAIGEKVKEKGADIEYIHCASDNHSIDGVILTDYKIGIVDGTAPHVIEPKAIGLIDEYVHLAQFLNREKLLPYKQEILTLNKEIAVRYQTAYDTFARALNAHKKVEKIYIANMDFHAANRLTEDLITRMFQGENREKEGKEVRRFLGAATPAGAVDFVPNLTEGLEKRYFIKGRAGSGKSTLLKKIADAGKTSGYDVEVYCCGFDPDSLDMVIIRERGIAIFDSTKPHEYFPTNATDEIVDLYEHCITPGTDERFAQDIRAKTDVYKQTMKEAISHLAEAKKLRDQLEAYYVAATDFSQIEQIQHELYDEIERAMALTE